MTFLPALRSCHRRNVQDLKYLKLTKSVATQAKLMGECNTYLPPSYLSHNKNKEKLKVSVHPHQDSNDFISQVSDDSTNQNSVYTPRKTTPDMFRNHAPYRLKKVTSSPVSSSLVSNPYFVQFEHSMPTESGQTTRPITSVAELVPEMAKNWTVWGGSGMIIKAFHHNGLIPYWGCMSLTNVVVRTSLLPLVVNGARTSARFAKVAPEVQFLVTNFQNDLMKLKEQKATPLEQFTLMRYTFQTLRGLYKLHDVNPFSVLKSPLLQIPIFWYFSIDVRKLINGGDPELAQQLTDSGFLWVTDLTDPDPWYGFPIISGMLLYLNVEMAIGQKSLSGKSASKSNLARILKDGFQSLAVFMPCFMSHSPAGVQIYLMTSFVFTLFQGMALRYDPIRGAIGLPAMDAPMPESKFAKEFIELKQLEKQAADARGDGPVLGIGVLAPGFQASFAGANRASSIISYTLDTEGMKEIQVQSFAPVENNADEYYIPACIRAPALPPNFELEAVHEDRREEEITETVAHVVSQSTDDIMEAANQGKRPKPPIQVLKVEKNNKDAPLSLKSLKSKKKRNAKPNRGKKPRRKT